MKIIREFYCDKDGKLISAGEKGSKIAFGEVHFENEDGETEIIVIGERPESVPLAENSGVKSEYTQEQLDRMAAAKTPDELLAAVDDPDESK